MKNKIKKYENKKNEKKIAKKKHCLIFDLGTILANSGEGFAKIDHYAYKPILTCKKTKIN